MRPTGTIHAARLAGSPRLQRLLAYLRDRGGQGATTREIIEGAGICAVNSAIDELRANGIHIAPAVCEGRGPGGGMVYRYRISEGSTCSGSA